MKFAVAVPIGFAAGAHQIGNALTQPDWNKRKWELRSSYWCER